MCNLLSISSSESRQILRIRVGSPARGCGGLLVDVKDVIIHPHYNSSILDYDVALLGLKEELDLKQSDKIKAIALPNPNSCLVEEMLCSVSGWGKCLKTIQIFGVIDWITFLMFYRRYGKFQVSILLFWNALLPNQHLFGATLHQQRISGMASRGDCSYR